MTNWLGNILKTKDARSRLLRTNIVYSMLLKIVGLTTSLLIVPITIDYLNNEVYGIWLTISSILYWFAFFDVGLSNGMRNYLTQSIARGDHQTATFVCKHHAYHADSHSRCHRYVVCAAAGADGLSVCVQHHGNLYCPAA